MAKSLIFPVNDKASQMQLETYPFKMSKDKFTYLGVLVTKHYRDLFKHNFKPALIQAKKDIERWSTLPLSMAGRINSVKMVIMPKLSSKLFHYS